MDEWNVPGLALSVVADGKVIQAKGYGVTDLMSENPVDQHTVFAIASTTKAFTATAAGMLVEDSLVSWDNPVKEQLPGAKLFEHMANGNLSIRDLLSHRTGYDRHDILWHAFDYDRSELLDWFGRHEPSWDPGERFRYQNIMYVVAGNAIEAATDMPWEQFVIERLLQPLSMTRSGTRPHEMTMLGNIATPHRLTRNGEVVSVPYRDSTNIGPAGSMYSTAADLSLWRRFLLSGGERADGQRHVMSQTIQEMFEPQIKIRPEDDPAVRLLALGTGQMNYGLGWYVHNFGDHLVVEHPGGIDGMSSIVTLLPERGIGVAILVNTTMPTGAHFALRAHIIDRFLGNAPFDWDGLMRDSFDRFKLDTASDAHSKQRTCDNAVAPGDIPGSYTSDGYGVVTVIADDLGLTIRFGEKPDANKLVPIGECDYLLVWQSPLFPPERVFFRSGSTGSNDLMELTSQGAELQFRKRLPLFPTGSGWLAATGDPLNSAAGFGGILLLGLFSLYRRIVR
jgi:CubicO group peptidase (beta-lactamase class C family)